jgi:hypothetical protein
MKLEAEFGAPDMRTARSLAAKALRSDANAPEIEPVLDFFETIGALLRRRALDEEFAWSSFSYWALRYAALARDRIQARRGAEADQTYYEEFDLLIRRFERVEVRRRHLKLAPAFSRDSLVSFLEEEMTD